MPATRVIDTGDPLPDTFTFTAVLGMPPYAYSIDITGIENSGITFVISGAENNVVDFDATNARGGAYVINLEGSVLDDPGQRDVDVDNYFVTVNPIIAAWAPGSLSIPSLDLGSTSSESATLTVSSGGAAPYTYHLSWLAGQSPVAGMTIEQTDTSDNSIEITIDGSVPGGTYQGTIIAEVGDATGQKQVVDSLPVTVTVEGMEGWAYNPLNISALTDEETMTTSSQSVLGGGTGGVPPYTFVHEFFSAPEPGLVLGFSGANDEVVDIEVAVGVDAGTHNGTIRGKVTDAVGNFIFTFLNYSVEVTSVGELVATDGIRWDSAHAASTISTAASISVTQLVTSHTPFAGSFHVLQLTLAGNRNLASHVSDITLDGKSLEEGNDFQNYLIYTKFGNWGATSMTAFLFIVRDNDLAFSLSDPRGPWTFEVTFAGGFDGTAVARYSTGSYMPIEGVMSGIPTVIVTGEGNPTNTPIFDTAPSPDQFYIPLSGPGVVGGSLLAGYALHMNGIEQIGSATFPNMVTPGDQGFQETNLGSLRPVNILSRLLNLYRNGRSTDAPLEQAAPVDPGDGLIYTGARSDVSQPGAWTCSIFPPLQVADDTWTPLMRALNPSHWWRFQSRLLPTTTNITDDGSVGTDLADGFTALDSAHHNVAGLDVAWEGISGALDMDGGTGQYSIITGPISASNTGTILMVFRHPVGAPPTNNDGYSPMFAYGRQGNSGEAFQLQINGLDGLEYRTLNTPAQSAAFEFVRTYSMSDLDNVTGFHLLALVKANDGDPPTLYIDGGRITSWSDVEGGSSDKGMWFADVTSAPGWFVKASAVTTNGWDGSIDELSIFITQELTQVELQELTLGLGLPIRGDG